MLSLWPFLFGVGGEQIKKELPEIDSQFHGSAHITMPGTNIYLDLGFPPRQAAELYEKSQIRMANTIAMREVLALTKKA